MFFIPFKRNFPFLTEKNLLILGNTQWRYKFSAKEGKLSKNYKNVLKKRRVFTRDVTAGIQ